MHRIFPTERAHAVFSGPSALISPRLEKIEADISSLKTDPVSMNCPVPYTHSTEGHSFAESIFAICNILLDRTRQENSGTIEDLLQSTLVFKQQLKSVFDTAAPFLTSKSHCTSLQNHLERLALDVHLHYAICRLDRVYLDMLDESVKATSSVVAECIQHATQAIESFLDLRRLSPSVCWNWTFVHNTVSCAITLNNFDSGYQAGGIMRRLMEVLEKEEKGSEWCDADTNVRCFGPFSRAL